ncbi:MAG TPA: YlxR family protein [Nocardioides sp.]|nr:YlxR family protein [Nocardioides sp.]
MSPADVGPVRTCLGCRQRAARQELLRVVAQDTGNGHEVVPDPARRLPGRGAHLHPTPACLALALRRRAFPRALRVPGALASGTLEEYVGSLAPHEPQESP